jgi:acyl dehydratase
MQARKESIKPGAVFVKERTYSRDEVRDFAGISRDDGVHHRQEDAQGRLMVHGLLTVALATEIGGDLDYIAGQMVLNFVRPVFTGDTVRCEVRIDSVVEEPGRLLLEMTVTARNQHGKDVLNGTSRGVILT